MLPDLVLLVGNLHANKKVHGDGAQLPKPPKMGLHYEHAIVVAYIRGVVVGDV
jgi:hypothetical protein